MQGIHRGFALRKLKVPARTGMSRDFVPSYPESLLPASTRYHGILGISTVNIYINEMKITVCLSGNMCIQKWFGKMQASHVELVLCLHGYLLFSYSIISIRVTGSKFVPG